LLSDVCRRYRIHRLSLFGSVLGEDFHSDSDVDVLVVFDAGCSPGWNVIDLEKELGGVFGGRNVDVVNRKFLNYRLRDRIIQSTAVHYEAPEGER
jgi:uncharacterized protein